jgi:flagellar biosynthesis anti-sigma factor FlgM
MFQEGTEHMKVNHNRDSVELSNAGRTKGAGKAGAAAKTEKAGEAGAAGPAAGVGAAAGIEISSEAKALSQANSIAKADTVDQAKVDKIKAMVNSGTYKPDFSKVADKMVNETMLQDLA